MKNPVSAASRFLGFSSRQDSSEQTRGRPSRKRRPARGRGGWPVNPRRRGRAGATQNPDPTSVDLIDDDPRDAMIGAEDWSEDQETLEPVAARAFSGRAVLLLLIVVALVLPLAPTVHRYFSQQAEISSLQEDIDSLKSQQQDLKEEKDRWNDDDYVKQQARDRLFYVQPGETPYVVTGQSRDSRQAADSSAEAATEATPTWGEALWRSVAAAK